MIPMGITIWGIASISLWNSAPILSTPTVLVPVYLACLGYGILYILKSSWFLMARSEYGLFVCWSIKDITHSCFAFRCKTILPAPIPRLLIQTRYLTGYWRPQGQLIAALSKEPDTVVAPRWVLYIETPGVDCELVFRETVHRNWSLSIWIVIAWIVWIVILSNEMVCRITRHIQPNPPRYSH